MAKEAGLAAAWRGKGGWGLSQVEAGPWAADTAPGSPPCSRRLLPRTGK